MSRIFKSKYFNFKLPPNGWTQEEFASALAILESMGEAALRVLLNRFGISFDGGNDDADEESLISVLITDSPKLGLLTALRDLHNNGGHDRADS